MSGNSADDLSNRLQRFYAKYCPEKAYKIPAAVQKAEKANSAEKLWTQLVKTYGPEPSPDEELDLSKLLWVEPTDAATSNLAPSPSEPIPAAEENSTTAGIDSSPPDGVPSDLFNRLQRFYAKYCPEKAYKIPAAVQKAEKANSAEKLWAQLVKTYGPEPGPDEELDLSKLVWVEPTGEADVAGSQSQPPMQPGGGTVGDGPTETPPHVDPSPTETTTSDHHVPESGMSSMPQGTTQESIVDGNAAPQQQEQRADEEGRVEQESPPKPPILPAMADSGEEEGEVGGGASPLDQSRVSPEMEESTQPTLSSDDLQKPTLMPLMVSPEDAAEKINNSPDKNPESGEAVVSTPPPGPIHSKNEPDGQVDAPLIDGVSDPHAQQPEAKTASGSKPQSKIVTPAGGATPSEGKASLLAPHVEPAAGTVHPISLDPVPADPVPTSNQEALDVVAQLQRLLLENSEAFSVDPPPEASSSGQGDLAEPTHKEVVEPSQSKSRSGSLASSHHSAKALPPPMSTIEVIERAVGGDTPLDLAMANNLGTATNKATPLEKSITPSGQQSDRSRSNSVANQSIDSLSQTLGGVGVGSRVAGDALQQAQMQHEQQMAMLRQMQQQLLEQEAELAAAPPSALQIKLQEVLSQNDVLVKRREYFTQRRREKQSELLQGWVKLPPSSPQYARAGLVKVRRDGANALQAVVEAALLHQRALDTLSREETEYRALEIQTRRRRDLAEIDHLEERVGELKADSFSLVDRCQFLQNRVQELTVLADGGSEMNTGARSTMAARQEDLQQQLAQKRVKLAELKRRYEGQRSLLGGQLPGW